MTPGEYHLDGYALGYSVSRGGLYQYARRFLGHEFPWLSYPPSFVYLAGLGPMVPEDVEIKTRDILIEAIENALNERRFDDTWTPEETFGAY